jgi:hypothetical protein
MHQPSVRQSPRLRRAAAAAALAALALTAPPADARAALSPARIIAKLNAQRRANAIPASITENPSWSRRCRAHNRYMRFNGLTHEEIRGRRGYSSGGAWAGHNAALASGSSWRHGNPWQNAPLHLSQLLNPRLRIAGAMDSSRHSCVTTFAGFDPTFTVPADTVFSFPGDNRSAPYAQRAGELPYTPQSRVGIREGAKTGPYLYVWAFSPPPADVPHTFEIVGYDENGSAIYADPNAGVQAADPLQRLVGGSVTGPDGRAVALKVIDDATVDGYLGDGAGILLPVHPLRKRTVYTVTATFATAADAENPHRYTGSFTFRTTAKGLGLPRRAHRRRGR